MPINRDELIKRLAEVSHLTYVRQKNRDQGVPLDELTLAVTDHDRERAEDIVAELERLGVLDQSSAIREPKDAELPEADAPPQPESTGQPLTDIWGYPIAGRRGRRR
jgi:hypothetical protein